MKSLSKKIQRATNTHQNEEDENSEKEQFEQDGFEAALTSKPVDSAWSAGGHQRDHIIQLLLNLVSNFGVYHTSAVAVENGKDDQNDETAFQEVFFKSTYALENVNGLRQFLRDMEDSLTRDLMIQISKYKMMQRYIVPLFCLSLDDRSLAMPLIRLFLYLTKPLSTSKIESLQKDIKRRKGKETVEQAAQRVEIEQRFRGNALEQAEALLSFKTSLVNKDVFQIILQHAAEPLLKEPELRTEEDKKVIECVLMLISNLLAIEPYSACSTAVISQAKEIQNKLVLALSDEFLGIILLLCQTVMDRVNRAWNLILVEIVSQLLKNRDPKDLLKAHQRLLQGTIDKPNPANTPRVPTQSNGILHNALARERAERNSHALCAGNRMNRFGGVFVVPSSIPASTPSSSSSSAEGENAARSSIPQIIRNPMALLKAETSRPQANKKRPKNCFARSNDLENVMKSSSFLSTNGGAEEQRALLVLADFLETFLSSGFNELVYSVKEGWRREDPMKHTEELMYFQMITSCLRYERIKIQANFRDRCRDPSANATPWKPSLKNITQCFDRMSIMRPITTMVSILDVSKTYLELVIPMELFKELICFLRIMLESEDTAHNDIALGALHKIFYISYSDRMDPVNSLLRAWKPERYSRHHLEVLLELVHETMKLLDIADYCFKKESADDAKTNTKKKNQKNEPVKEDERSQYLAAALRFDPHEYFRRLVCSQTVRFYIRALELYSTNSPPVNHHIFVFLQRLCSYRIEDDHSIKLTNSADSDFLPGQVSLGHMLYNLPALTIFSTILNDSVALSDKHLEPLVRLLKGIVRRFGESVQRNHLIFVEILFPRNLLNWGRIESVYDAQQYVKGKNASTTSDSHSLDRDEPETTVAAPSSESESTDSGEEFNENLDILRVPISKQTLRQQKKQTTQRKKSRREKFHNSDTEEDKVNDELTENSNSDSDNQRTRKRIRQRKSPSPPVWSENEDDLLRKLYETYRGGHSTFNIIAMDPLFIELGGERTAEQVEQRVHQLKLDRPTSISSSSSRHEPEVETYEQSLQYDSETLPRLESTPSPPWEVSKKQNKMVSLTPDGNDADMELEEEQEVEEEEEEDEKWKRVQKVVEPKKSSRKLIKSRKITSNKEDSDDEFDRLEENTPSSQSAVSGRAVEQPINPYPSVILDSDDDEE